MHNQASCLCGSVRWEITAEPFNAFNCHCKMRRKARAAAHATNGFTSLAGVEFVRGADNLAHYKVPDAEFFVQVFCRTCGSKLPRLDEQRKLVVVPFGGLDDDPGARPARHIYVDDRAKWYDITDDLPAYGQEPAG